MRNFNLVQYVVTKQLYNELLLLLSCPRAKRGAVKNQNKYTVFAIFGLGCPTARQIAHAPPLLGPLWADMAEILGNEQVNVWLQMIQISLTYNEVRMCNG